MAFDEDIAGNEIGDIGIHRYDGAALEERAFGARHGVLHRSSIAAMGAR
jgi:hypothetical protein